jgi:hypothetical protein
MKLSRMEELNLEIGECSLLEGRFGEPLDEGDFICMEFDGKKSRII